MTDYDGQSGFNGNNVTGTKLDTVVVWKGTALPVGSANKVPQYGFFCLVDSLTTPTTTTWYIQTSATITSPSFVEVPMARASELAYLKLSVTELDYTSPANAVGSSGSFASDITEDFTSYADQSSADTVYPSSDTAKVRVNVTNDNIDVNCVTDGTNDSLSREVSLLNNVKFKLRFKITIASHVLNGSGYEQGIHIGVSSADHNTGEESNQDGVSFEAYHDNIGTRKYRVTYGDGSRLGGNQQNFSTAGYTLGTPHYVQIEGVSATSVEFKVYSDSAYTILVETQTLTIPITLTGHKYFVIKNHANTQNQSGNLIGTVDDVKFYNNASLQWVSASEVNPNIYYDLASNRELVSSALSIDKTLTTVTSIKIRGSTDTSFSDGENIAYINISDFTDDTFRYIANNFLADNVRYIQIYGNGTGVLAVNEAKFRYGVSDLIKILTHRHKTRTLTSADSFVDSN